MSVLETMDGSTGGRVSAATMGAMASCARQIKVPLELVLRARNTGRLGDMIAACTRSGRPIEMRNAERVRYLYRRRELSLLSDRAALLEQRAR
jgi:hypothetical protein